jgi:YjbE family integral membrane protein
MLEIVQAVAAITLIDLAMSGDNALVIGMVARGLPRSQRRKAIVFGAGAAVALRVVAAAAVTLLLTVPYLQLIGGLALVVIAYRLVRPEQTARTVPAVTTLRAAVLTILAADFAMSLENILGVGAAAHGNVALLLFGLGLSIPIVLFGSGIVVTILDRVPQATWLGALAILWTAAELILSDPVLPRADLPYSELILTAVFVCLVLAARLRRGAVSWIGVSWGGQRERRERQAS